MADKPFMVAIFLLAANDSLLQANHSNFTPKLRLLENTTYFQ
jgi:hypothetical protein